MRGRKEAGYFSGKLCSGGYKGGYRGVATIRTAPRKFLAKIVMYWGDEYRGIQRGKQKPRQGGI